MTALLSAELLRLRTVRAPRYVFLGVLALVAISAAPVGNPPPSSASEVVVNLRGLAQLGALWPRSTRRTPWATRSSAVRSR